MIHKPEAKSLRAANGMERMRRFANSSGALRMQAGGELPMNTTPMGTQDQGAFDGLQNTATGDPSAAPATAAPRAPSASRHAADQSLLGAGNFKMEIPGLRNGGEIHAADGFFGNLRKAIMPTDAEKVAKQQYLDSTRAPTPAPTAPAPKAISSYAGNGALEGRMKAAGLRNGGDLRTGQGGHVPGSGSGDKIPAKYEPGEFVVSNDMLDAQPELRTHLRDLRENVLAQKGMTPEQADAKAMTGGGLRAEGGFGKLFPYNRPEKDIYAGIGKPASAPENTPPPGGILSPQQQEGAANGKNQRTVAVAGPANSGGASGGWGNTGGAASVAGGTGRAAGAVSRPEDEFMPGTKAVFNEGGKDMAAAWNQGKYTKAAFTGLRQLATYPTAVADDVLGGAVRGAYDLARNPAEDAARAVLGMEDRKEPVPSAAPRPVTNVPGANANQTNATFQRLGLRQVKGNAGRGTVNPTMDEMLTNQDMQDPTGFSNAQIAARNPNGRVTKIVDANGRTSYSGANVTGEVSFQGADGKTLRGRPGGGYMSASGDGGDSLAAARATLRNPDGGQWSTEDNAIMAANIRDGVDKYRGTSRQPATNKYAGLPIKTAAAMRVADIQAASSRENAQLTANTSLRTNAADNAASAERTKYDRDNDKRKYDLDVLKVGVDAANKNRDDKRAGDEAFDKRIKDMSGEDAPAMHEAINGYLAKQEAALIKALATKPNDPVLLGELRSIRERERSGIADPLLRKLLQGVKANRVIQAGSGSNNPFNPFDGTSVNTNQPVGSLTADQSFTSRWLPGAGKYVTDNGQKILASDVEKNPDLKELIR